MRFIKVENDGAEVRATNYWETEHARRGIFFLSLNAGAFRLLVPPANESVIAELRTAQKVIVSRGPWAEQGQRDALELLFDDGTETPFSIHLVAEQVDRFPAGRDAGLHWEFAAWIRGADGPECAYRAACRFREVPRLPWLKPDAEDAGGQRED